VVARHQRALRKDEQRRAVLGHQLLDLDAVDLEQRTRRALTPELVHQAHLMSH